MNFSIVGAGPCGIGAAHRLNSLGYQTWQVYELSDHVGGLSASFADDNGFTWDIGGHVLFSHYDYFDRAVEESLQGEYYEHQRESWVRTCGTWVPYPFQNNVRYLPELVLQECVDGLRNLEGNLAGAANFSQWLDAVFGAGIVKHFMEPYNRKVWGTPLEQMSKEWIAERVSVVDLARIERNIAEGRDDLSWGPNNTFRFPKRGGTGAIFSGIARRFPDRIMLTHELIEVDLAARELAFANGRREYYDVLITTIPLDIFIGLCKNVPARVHEAASQLIHNSGLIVGIGVEGKRRDSRCWMYFPEDNCPFYRVTNFHNYSPWNLPDGDISRYFSLMCETTYSSHKPVRRETIIEDTVQGLVNVGLLTTEERERIISRYLIDIPYSYPVPSLGRDAALAVINPFLESQGVYSRGRFGAWKYEVGNMDHSFMQGVEVVERILTGAEESTF
ncbi:NAD(P)/FAD-dependent oxidoreductase [Geobacter sp. DSM 9736]|uniref:protoporphyrinogen/coproporphyrinogen oxidase n=1 Tax=Geobacter sp. DSM 9736 TaxID=1277350 RepID=UPI000B4FF7E9|nr:FAD-dependent oxidoreductase [Geobacter sp. DSM 9736]SNB45827.1 UDP-galactopyranose mutase [Geobacter sp. DSM 9736]